MLAYDAKASELAALLGQLGFRKTGVHRSKDVERWFARAHRARHQCEPDGFAHSLYLIHGAGVCAVAIDVDDAGRTVQRAEALRVRTFYEPATTSFRRSPPWAQVARIS
jgi:4-hydroxyphenylpyruvate dioxygenase